MGDGLMGAKRFKVTVCKLTGETIDGPIGMAVLEDVGHAYYIGGSRSDARVQARRDFPEADHLAVAYGGPVGWAELPV